MQYCSASDLKNRSSELIDLAQREPVMIQKKGRDVAVILASVDYARYQEYQKHAFLEFCDDLSDKAAKRGLTPEILADILAESEDSEGSTTKRNV